MRAGLFSRVAWQLRTHTGVGVYAWMPVLGVPCLPDHPLADLRGDAPRTHVEHHARPRRSTTASRRSTPRVRALVGDIYEDLAPTTPIAGPTCSPTTPPTATTRTPARGTARTRRAGACRPTSPRCAPIPRCARAGPRGRRASSPISRSSSRSARRDWQPRLLTARNLYARPVLEPAARGVVRAGPRAVAAGLRLHRRDGDALHGAGGRSGQAWLSALFRQWRRSRRA